ncbi:hypothetical protein [Ereboglobus luteus]|uniref:Uncharacterized protein n=1 Tax=Ereboglobus luteus TaxID=1796921 RepID=A0A2U8E3C0_9BACT|nr:hypothetical protein [Ereboglobus luteus]AWI09285.1 hypothetical protein CKA38_08540 [Ereboglobus luteus]
MKKLYVIVPTVATVAFAAFVYWTAAPNPWRTLDCTTNGSNQCEVHHTAMEKKKVAVIYGLMAPEAWLRNHLRKEINYLSFSRMAKKEFPHARDIVFGGCEISNTSPASAYLYVCPQCVNALATKMKVSFEQ